VDNENPVFRSLELIENRISEKLTVEYIASGVYFSKYHYQRLFREIVGNSVMEYVTKRKLTLAGRALLETDAAILDIALEYGYDSREGFTRSFKAYMGVTPTEYRKYGLASISQKTVKERSVMIYSKTTDEILRELNGFIAKAKETAVCARKNDVPEYTTFWCTIADATDACADKVKGVLDRITAISERPDEIGGRFAIIKVIEEIAFHSNLLAFNAGLMVSREQSEQWPLCEKYLELARTCVLKANKVAQFFNELSALIFDDMRKAASQKIQEVVKKGKAAEERIVGYSYIKQEVAALVNELSAIPCEEITVSRLEDCLFKLDIFSFAADMDVSRRPDHKAIFEGLTEFKECVSEAIDFFQTLIKPEKSPILECAVRTHFTDIAFQENVLLFYTRGEVSYEKLGKFLSDEQKAAFGVICNHINNCIQFTLNANEETAYKTIAAMLYDIHSHMLMEADKLKENGGAIRFIAGEFKGLADNVMRGECADEKQ